MEQQASAIEYVPLDEAVKEYGVPKTTLWRHFRRGSIEGVKHGGKIHLRRASLDEAFHSISPAGAPEIFHSTWNETPGSIPPGETFHSMRNETPGSTLTDEMERDGMGSLPGRRRRRHNEIRDVHALAVRVDALHQELRRAERDNEGLRFELQRYRLALEENARSLVEREARAREAEAKLVEADVTLRIQLDTELLVRRQIEEKNAALTDESLQVKERADLAELRVKYATEEAERLRAALEDERKRAWWRRLLRR